MSYWNLHFQGVGNASAVELGSAMATLQKDGEPWLTIDCGAEGLTAYIQYYKKIPSTLFITHTHLDHISGFERLFTENYFNPIPQNKIKLFVPAKLVALLHQRVGDYPNVAAEGGANFWDAFQLIPVGDSFWHLGQRLEVFPVRHHWPDTAYGLRLVGSIVWSGDTRPIPEILTKYANQNELIAHDCSLAGNPSHTGLDDLEREYCKELRSRMVLYHYGSKADGERLSQRGYRVALPEMRLELASPTA